MQYAMLIHDKPGYVEALAEDEQKALFARVRSAGAGSARPGR